MKRRDFFRSSGLGVAGIGVCAQNAVAFDVTERPSAQKREVFELGQEAENIIFLVSDGMSQGALQLADLLAQLKMGRKSHWISLYDRPMVRRALMDTASADSWVTDSAAASSAWGGGVRVPNGSLNVGANGETYEPILQKFKNAGKAVGCVTTVPITHATPAGFCVNSSSRGSQASIAEQYLQLRFDVMLGGGTEFFDPTLRQDGKDLFSEFSQEGYLVAQNRQALLQAPQGDAPVMGVFHRSGLPYALDHQQDAKLLAAVPTLPEMTRFAIDRLKQHPNGFVLQVEGGKVDWAAHANDSAALLYDQLAFDEALAIALEFADENKRTLVIVTTDHGNSNPGLMGTSGANKKFERLLGCRQSLEWVFRGLQASPTQSELTERIEYATGVALSTEESQRIFENIPSDAEERQNPYKLPYSILAEIMKGYTGIDWSGDDHSGDYVELALMGPGSQLLPHFVKNTDLHQLMLTAALSHFTP
jgi:alkaline phosphatase